MLLSKLYPNHSLNDALYYSRIHMNELAKELYKNNWTVIGSLFKTPKVYQWSTKSKEELINQAYRDFYNNKANSINLRISDSKVIAFDCDFYNTALMRDFIEALPLTVGLSKEALFTCTGGKGGKIFFQYCSPLNGNERLPSKLGLSAYDKENNDKSKQELEIKRHISTVAGLHSPVFDSNQSIIDYKVYSHYEGTKHICQSSPNRLPKITKREINCVQELYNNLLKSHNAVNQDNKPLRDNAYDYLVISSIFYFLQPVALRNDSNEFTTLKANDTDIEEIEPIYKALGLHDGLKCIKHIFYGERLEDEYLQKLCKRYKSAVCNDCKFVLGQGRNFERLIGLYDERLRSKVKDMLIMFNLPNEVSKYSLNLLIKILTIDNYIK